MDWKAEFNGRFVRPFFGILDDIILLAYRLAVRSDWPTQFTRWKSHFLHLIPPVDSWIILHLVLNPSQHMNGQSHHQMEGYWTGAPFLSSIVPCSPRFLILRFSIPRSSAVSSKMALHLTTFEHSYTTWRTLFKNRNVGNDSTEQHQRLRMRGGLHHDADNVATTYYSPNKVKDAVKRIIIITQWLLISIVMSPKGLNMRSFVQLDSFGIWFSKILLEQWVLSGQNVHDL